MGETAILSDLSIRIFADGADRDGIVAMAQKPWIRGFTTNPSLMRKAGVSDYAAFARDVLRSVRDLPISFEVITDDFDEMEAEAREIASWAPNVYVKIPVTNSGGEPSAPLIRRLSADGIKINVTGILPLEQVRQVAGALEAEVPAVVSVFAGRIADTGVDPVPHMIEARALLRSRPHVELLWASPREILNIFQANAIGCDIITVTNDLLAKLPLIGKDLAAYSLETVRALTGDARKAGLTLRSAAPRR